MSMKGPWPTSNATWKGNDNCPFINVSNSENVIYVINSLLWIGINNAASEWKTSHPSPIAILILKCPYNDKLVTDYPELQVRQEFWLLSEQFGYKKIPNVVIEMMTSEELIIKEGNFPIKLRWKNWHRTSLDKPVVECLHWCEVM